MAVNKVIEIEDLYFAYEEDWVLQGINLEVEEGEFLAFIGPNGSGKSTLLELILGFIKPQRGRVRILGQSPQKFSARGQVGYISQKARDFNPSFPATVEEIVGANLYPEMGFWKILNRELRKKIDRALALVDMEKFKKKPIGRLSGGQQQRIFIARTLVTEPRLIFMDEPLIGVDQEAQGDFYRVINQLHRQLGITIILVSHDLHVISRQVNRIICFAGGRVHPHCAGEFDYNDYIRQAREEDKLLIPRHEHGE